ncbi:hypothetical protein NDU88_006155 [Pleurodeles waltl]|uniref:Uncharacterized protein n=1 Tax=Pleurodeles waltl TaxID=8319 RepID=A0AAV7MCM3_PLEWA|nr:hypothetical protein NDU88_006155 [Pleurodeles waltl]
MRVSQPRTSQPSYMPRGTLESTCDGSEECFQDSGSEKVPRWWKEKDGDRMINREEDARSETPEAERHDQEDTAPAALEEE